MFAYFRAKYTYSLMRLPSASRASIFSITGYQTEFQRRRSTIHGQKYFPKAGEASGEGDNGSDEGKLNFRNVSFTFFNF